MLSYLGGEYADEKENRPERRNHHHNVFRIELWSMCVRAKLHVANTKKNKERLAERVASEWVVCGWRVIHFGYILSRSLYIFTTRRI